MNKRLITILIVVFSVIIAAETFFLLSSHSDKSDNNTSHSAGNISFSETSVTINNVQIPSYDLHSAVYIVAEDLVRFGFELSENDDMSVSLDYIGNTSTDISEPYCSIPDASKVQYFQNGFMLNSKPVQCYITYSYHLFPAKNLRDIAVLHEDNNILSFTLGKVTSTEKEVPPVLNAAAIQGEGSKQQAGIIEGSTNAKSYRSPSNNTSKIVVLDPGHGKSSSLMSTAEKEASGYSYHESKQQWGEWRHWKSGSSSVQCEGSGCTKTHTSGGSCWYPIINGDRDIEPDINLKNALAAKKYLEQLGYIVRLTRSSNDENPSFSKRISYCYPNNDNTQRADALLYMCIHSNAGGGSGSAYISAGGAYDQKGIRSTYINDCNTLGSVVNEKIVSTTSLKKSGSGVINGMGALIAFNKAPVTCGYMEIGYYDNSSDLNILHTESDAIGKAIADGIHEFLNGA